MKGFVEFIQTQGVVGLAVGFILGAAISDLIKSLVENIVNPLLGIILNHAKALSEVTVSFWGVTVKYGAFMSSFINFCVIAAVVYFVIKGVGLEKLDKKKEDK